MGIPYRERSDADLVSRVLAGETDAFGGLVARYRPRLARYAMRMLGDREDAEDALQDAFVRAYRSLRRCDPPRFGPWVFAILVNRCRTLGAQRARRQRVVVADPDGRAGATAADPAERAAWGDAVRWAVARLGEQQREAFLLKHVEELSYEEMAGLTGASVSALKMRVKRACEELRTLLQEAERV